MENVSASVKEPSIRGNKYKSVFSLFVHQRSAFTDLDNPASRALKLDFRIAKAYRSPVAVAETLR
ncbi:hypothetical protein OH492_28685 [Vibrio chagasii]|nr:hypothetical protein [Vibrio chagasii]